VARAVIAILEEARLAEEEEAKDANRD